MGQKPQFTKVAKGSSVRDSSEKEAAAEPLRRNYVWPYQADRERILVCGTARAVEKGAGFQVGMVGSRPTTYAL